MKKRAFTLAELGLLFFIMAILAVIFYRTTKPSRVIYNNLYYSAYEQLKDVYVEIKSYGVITEKDNQSAFKKDSNGLNVLDLEKFVELFRKKVNFVGTPSGLNERVAVDEDGLPKVDNDNNQVLRLEQFNDNKNFYVFDNKLSGSELFGQDAMYSVLTNGMQIRMDLCRDSKRQNEIIIATVDVNGNNEPNLINKDIVQFEISDRGVFPLGVLENDEEALAFNVISRYRQDNGQFNDLYMTSVHFVEDSSGNELRNLSYEDAACRANVPRASHHYSYDSVQGKYIADNCLTTIQFCKKFETQNIKTCELETVRP